MTTPANNVEYPDGSPRATPVYITDPATGKPFSSTNGAVVVIQAVAGTALLADQSNTELRASLYGKNSTAGDTPVLVDSSGRVLGGVSTVALYTTAQISVGSNNSGDLAVGSYHEVSIDITTTLVTTNLQFFWERKGADGNYYVLWQSAVLTTSANVLSTSVGPGLAYNQSLGITGRFRWVATGNASFTPNIYAK